MTEPNLKGSLNHVSVVIPSFRAQSTISRAVESALHQNDGRVQVIVVIDDNCGMTESNLRDMRDDRIEVIRNERNLGAPASRNKGLERVNTPYVTFLDADDHYLDDLLGPLIRKIRMEKADLGFGPSTTWNPKRGYSNRRVANYKDQEDVFQRWLGQRVYVNTASVVWTTEYVRAIGGWDARVRRNQDGEIALRAMLLGGRFTQTDQGAGVWTNDRSTQRISTRTDNLDSLLYLVDKFMGMRSEVVSDTARTNACLRYCLIIAHLAFSNGEDAIGAKALHLRKKLGGAGVGAIKYRMSALLHLIPRGPRMAAWSGLRAIRDLARHVVPRRGFRP